MILPAAGFILYIFLAACALLFRLSYIGWFGPYLLAVVIAAPPLILLLSLPSMLGMRLSLNMPEICAKNSLCNLCLNFDTRHLLPLSHVRVAFEFENLYTGERWKSRHMYVSVGSCVSYVPLHTAVCGQIQCRVTGFECRDLLGLFVIRRRSTAKALCTVLPNPVKSDSPVNIDAAMNSAVCLKPKYGGGFSEEHDLREYRQGDTVKSIHWKLSSKTDHVIVREPLENVNNRVYLVLARAGARDRGLEVLRWLSGELCTREIPHIIVADKQYSIGNEAETDQALCGLLSSPMSEPCLYDPSDARCVFIISDGEVRTQ